MLLAITREGCVVMALALVCLALVVLVALRSVAGAILVLVPLLMGVLWLVVVMVATDFKFNFFNVVVLPSILGIGIDSGVHVFHRYREEGRGSVRNVLGTTGGAVLVSALTTMVGFGGLVFAHHPGLRSIGVLAVTGIFLTLVAALVVLPAILDLLERYKSET
jgi:predicted RND superfamily exporter protein